MKIIYIGLYRQLSGDKAIRLSDIEDVSSFGFFTRGTISQHLHFGARTAVARTPGGQRQTIAMDSASTTTSSSSATASFPFVVHAYVRHDGLGACVVADKEYPARVAFSLITKVMLNYEEEHGYAASTSTSASASAAAPAWQRFETDQHEAPSASLSSAFSLYQNPREADKLTAVQLSLDEVKNVMSTNIDSLMRRGETLDALMEKSDDLNLASVQFYKQAKKTNACCTYF